MQVNRSMNLTNCCMHAFIHRCHLKKRNDTTEWQLVEIKSYETNDDERFDVHLFLKSLA